MTTDLDHHYIRHTQLLNRMFLVLQMPSPSTSRLQITPVRPVQATPAPLVGDEDETELVMAAMQAQGEHSMFFRV